MVFTMKIIKKLSFIYLVLVILFISGCSSRTEEEILKEKVVQELEYLDTQIIGMLNRLNNISFDNYTVRTRQISLEGNQDNESKEQEETALSTANSEEKTEETRDTINVTSMEPNTILVTDYAIDWIKLKQEIELLNSSWSVILLDLHALQLDSDDILTFSATLDECILAIKDENKKDALINLANLYKFIPMYLSSMPEENARRNIKQTKSYIINSYVLVEQNNWDEILKNIQEADNIFKGVMTDIDFIRTREYKVNQAYVLLKELQQSVGVHDYQLFYMKYKNVMESMNVM